MNVERSVQRPYGSENHGNDFLLAGFRIAFCSKHCPMAPGTPLTAVNGSHCTKRPAILGSSVTTWIYECCAWAYYMTCYAVLRSCTLAAHMYCHAGYVANTSASGVGLGWGGCDNVMYAGVTYNLLSKGKSKKSHCGNTYGVDSGVASMRATFSRAWVSSAKTNGMESRKKFWNSSDFRRGLQIHGKTQWILMKALIFERAVPRFCACACQQFLMISVQNYAFSAILRKRCEEMHFENRKQYSAPAGALTMFLPFFLTLIKNNGLPFRPHLGLPNGYKQSHHIDGHRPPDQKHTKWYLAKQAKSTSKNQLACPRLQTPRQKRNHSEPDLQIMM